MMQLPIAGLEQTFTIPNGADGSAVTAVSLGGKFKELRITCADAQYIAATTGLTAFVGYTSSDTLVAVYAANDPSTLWSQANLPTSGTFTFRLTHAPGAMRVRLVLSNNASGGSVVFTVQGLEKYG